MLFVVSCVIVSQAAAFSPRCHFAHSLTPLPKTTDRTLTSCLYESVDTLESSSIDPSISFAEPHLVFPGGGIFFYWQAGVVSYLREEGYDLDAATMAGASAGALTATLTASNVDFYHATSLALDLAEEEGVWDRTGGLQGVWGPMIERWLNEMLPSNVVDLVNNRVS